MFAMVLRGDVLPVYEKAEILLGARITSGGCLLYLQEMGIGRIQEAIFWRQAFSRHTFFWSIHKKKQRRAVEVRNCPALPSTETLHVKNEE